MRNALETMYVHEHTIFPVHYICTTSYTFSFDSLFVLVLGNRRKDGSGHKVKRHLIL